MDWDDVRVFLAVARKGSMRAAGRTLGLVALFEKALNVSVTRRRDQGERFAVEPCSVLTCMKITEPGAPVGTTIKKLLVKEGDRVKRGQLLAQLDDADASSQAARALAQVRASQADVSAQQSGGNREEVLTLEAQLVKSRNERDTAQRSLEALKRLQQQGAASPGEVKQAEDQLAAAEADLTLVQQKQKERYSQPEIVRVEAQTAEAQSAASHVKLETAVCWIGNQLVDQCGLKGFRIGDAQISHIHANIMVNLGHATASDVRALIADLASDA
jgi:multidrug efflux pump subunit AcrA (membrane-fusion protein)